MPRRPSLDPHVVASAADMIRVLGHPVRLRIVEALERGECCVSELQDTVGQSQATVSQQLARMRAAGIVTCRRDGPNMRYTVADRRVLRILDCIRSTASSVRTRSSGHPTLNRRMTRNEP